jgi:TRAP-type uncharacterized transport system substrate-binding protein
MLGLGSRALFKGLGVIFGILAISWLALEYFVPSPPSSITLASGPQGTSLLYFGQRYRERLARVGIDVDLRETAGTTENCKLLHDPNSGVDVSIVTPGFCDNSRGSELLSLGDVYVVPIWIFYSSPEPLVGLSQLKGKRIAAGQEGSGVRDIAERILGKANIDSKTATLLPQAGNAAVDALNSGKVDAVIIISVPRAPALEALLSNPRFRLIDFSTAEAFTRIFPYFVKLVWPKGMVEIDPPNPPNDVTLLGATSRVVARGNLHPAIVQILARTLKEEHDGPGPFQRAGEFPKSIDSEFPMSQIAVDYYKNGPSFLQEYLPFWMAIYARRTIALLVAALAIAFPVFSVAPRLYGWLVQEQLRKLYRRLRVVEDALRVEPTVPQLETLQSEIAAIDRATRAIPMRNSDLYFMLRYHLDRTRSRLVETGQADKSGAG